MKTLTPRAEYWHGYRDAIGVHVHRRWRDRVGEPLPTPAPPLAAPDWSRRTPGAVTLARAILRDAINPRAADRYAERFAAAVVARLQYPSFILSRDDIALWFHAYRRSLRRITPQPRTAPCPHECATI